MDGDYEEDEWSVEEWLEKAGLGEYTAAFIDNGYDTPELCASLKVEDLDAIGVTNKYHRGIVFTQARQLLAAADDYYNRSAHLSPNLAPTSEYSEPWAGNHLRGEVGKQNGVLQVTEAKEGKKSRKRSKDKVEKSSKLKQHSPAPAISPTLPPYQRDGGGALKLTKLQLKLKLREELQKDRIILTEAPYCLEDGTANEELLTDLGERYAAQFRVDSLEAYDAIKEIFKHETNKSDFATSAGRGQKLSREETDASSKSQRLGEDPSTNYDEPFDTQKGIGQNLASRKANKSKTMPASGQAHYDEPFDVITVDVKGREGKITATGKQEGKSSRLKPDGHSPMSSPEERRHSADETAARKSPKISPKTSPKISPKTSPKGSKGFRLFRKKQKPRSHSVKDFDRVSEELDIKYLDTTARRKHGSAENLQDMGRVPKGLKSPKRTSVPYFTFSNGNPPPLPPNHPSRSSAGSTTSDSDGSPNPPKKKHPTLLTGFHSPPTYRKAVSNGGETVRSGSFSGGYKIERKMTKTSSDMEINKLEERETAARQALRMSRSHDELRNIVITVQDPPPHETGKLKKDKGNFIRRLFKWKSSTPGTRKKMLKGDNRVSVVSDRSSLTSSMSMPEINRLSVEPAATDYAEVFDTTNANHEETRKPQKPFRQFQKSPLVSPNDPPLVHRRLEIKSGSDSSTTDHLVIPIQSGSAPEQTGSYLRNGVAHGNNHSPELEDVRFSDSDDQRSEKTASFGSPGSGPHPPTDLTTPRAEDSYSTHSRPSSQVSQTEDAAASTHNSRCSSSASSVSTEQSSMVSEKPLPPPKPAKSLKRKPNPPQSLSKPSTAKPSGGVPMETSHPKPPPKPARSKHRSIIVDGRIIENAPSDGINRKSRSLKERTPTSEDAEDARFPPALLEKSSSEKSLRLSERLGSNASTLSTDSNASDGPRKPKPLPKPRTISKPAPPPKAAKSIEIVVLEKLAKEGIDLTQTPYSTVWGEGAIPYPLVTRYAGELRQSEAKVAQALDTVRGKKLKKFSREYVPMTKEQWQSHLSPCMDSTAALLTSFGLPMYADTFKSYSVHQLLNIGEAELEALQIKQKHREILMGYIYSA